jgi:acetyl-CoA hydrolase
MSSTLPFPRLTADEAATLIHDGVTCAFSGFTAAGAAKAVPRAIAARAREMHKQGLPYSLRVLTGASTGHALDDELADADAIAWRAPYQSSRPLRDRINRQQTEFLDLHISHVPQMIDFGFLGPIDIAVVEVVDISPTGEVVLSTSSGISPTILQHAGKVILELNRHHSPRLREMHDVLVLPRPPRREPIPIRHPLDRVGRPQVAVDPGKIVGIVETNEPDGVSPFAAPDAGSRAIAGHVVRFLVAEMRAGRIPAEFLPLQSGVGNIANAVIGALGADPAIPPFMMYTEVLQDAAVDLMQHGKLLGASTTSLTVSEHVLQRVYGDMDLFAKRIVIRPQELSNSPGVVRRLGVIAINTILEMDIYGCANSTHVCGTQLMNGIGGSGDFVRNSYLSILVAPSIAKAGKISTVVPMVSHCDHNEHSVQILVTEQGLADLRGLGPVERARTIIDRCAHPSYRDYLRRYISEAPMGHLRHDLSRCFELHQNYLKTGSMLPG